MNYEKIPVLDDRLYLAASFVRDCAKVCDVGTDHAYIPIYLINSGICSAAIASDINRLPLEKAKEHARLYDAADDMIFCLADGLKGLPLSENGITDIIICGMGGELIASIIENCPYVFDENIRLILQPMTKIAHLREYLSNNGFSEADGGIAEASGKLYQCLVYSYSGKEYFLTESEKLLGRCEGIRRSPLFPDLIDRYIKKCEKELSGKREGNIFDEKKEKLLSELLKLKESL